MTGRFRRTLDNIISYEARFVNNELVINFSRRGGFVAYGIWVGWCDRLQKQTPLAPHVDDDEAAEGQHPDVDHHLGRHVEVHWPV